MSYITVTMHMLLYQWAHHDESIHMLGRSCELHNSNYVQALQCTTLCLSSIMYMLQYNVTYAHVVTSMGTS